MPRRILTIHFLLSGKKNAVEKGLDYPNVEGFVNDYKPEVNPQILTEHATAAFRGPHSEIVGYLKYVGTA